MLLKFVDGLTEAEVGQSYSHSNERPQTTRKSPEPESGIGQQAPTNAISIARRDSIHYDSNFTQDYDDNTLGHNYDTIGDPQTFVEDSLIIRSMDFSITPAAFHSNERAENGLCHSQSGSLEPGRMSDVGSSSSHSFSSPSEMLSSNSRSRLQLRGSDAAASGSRNNLYRSSSNLSFKTSQQLLKYYIDSVAPWVSGIITCLKLVAKIGLARNLQSRWLVLNTYSSHLRQL
jgi:hypothetical protein